MNDATPIIAIGLAALFGLFCWAAVAEHNKWKEFSHKHECRTVGKMSGELFNTFDMKGNVGIGYTPGKTGWLCNDGVTYWR